jgi:hypothetical protein
VIVAGIAAGRLASAWWKYRGKESFPVPKNHQAAGVTLDTKYACLAR